MIYIDLNLKQHNSDNQNIYNLNQIINNNQIIIILGSPGSGKTSIFKKYQEENESAQFLSIQKFIKFPKTFNKSKNILLLDGLDEFRSISTDDKTFVLTELGIKVKKLLKKKELKIAISCREMDWYGELDVKALKDELNYEVSIFKLCPLNYHQQLSLAQLWELKEPEILVKKYSNTGFLTNPQMFRMFADLYKKDNTYIAKPKKDIYFDFFNNAGEKNKTRNINKINYLDNDEKIKYIGYIAFYYFFSNEQINNTEFIDKICSNEKGYSKDKLEIAINTNLFNDNQFIHRTIAEFSCALYLNDKIKTGFLSLERIKSLFINKNRIPTDLRGVYAWLCAFTGNDELIKIDPYYQLIHGDNSGFNIKNKMKIILAVKEYSKENPYFINFYYREKIDNFYEPELDDFLIQEYEEAINLENHYVYFLNLIITSSEVIGNSLIEFIKKIIFNNDVKNYYKKGIIKSLLSDVDFLILTLDSILENKIEDYDDSLKDEILHLLYPTKISPLDVIIYLFNYNKKTIGHCYYLYNTKFEDKYELVDKILSRCKPQEKYDYLKIPENLESFVEDYFMEIILYYEKKFTSKEIYKILKHFKSYFGLFQNINFRTYRYDLNDILKINKDKLINLSNELYSLYLDDILMQENYFSIYNEYIYFISFQKPTKIKDILISKLKKELDKNKLFFLLTQIYHESDEKDRNKELIEFAKNYEIEDKILEWLNPKKIEYSIEFEKRRQEREDEKKDNIKKNEIYLKNKTDDEILKCFRDLNYTSNLLFIDESNLYENYITKKTFKRMKNILKKLLVSELIEPNLLNIKTLVKNSPDIRRNIDHVYYVSCCLNNKESFNKIKNSDFLEYLYIISITFNRSSNVIKGTFIKWIEEEKKRLALDSLLNFLSSLFNTYLTNYKNILFKQIENEDDIEKLKRLSKIYLSEKTNIENNLIYNFIKEYNFKISNDILEKFSNDEVINKENKELVLALLTFNKEKKENFTIQMAVNLYKIIEGYRLQKYLSLLDKQNRIRFIHYLFDIFNTEELIQAHNGVQSDDMNCAFFLSNEVLNLLTTDELLELKYLHSDDNDIWKKRILTKISEQEQKDIDLLVEKYSIEKAKDFILSADILNTTDFFNDLILKIEFINTIIESNRDKEKEMFYDSDGTPRNEEYCRDRIVNIINQFYGYNLKIIREKYEANNKADINICYKINTNYEVQMECKKDNNKGIYVGVKTQLIDKYLSKNVKYGIYLIFYFGDKKNKNLMLKKINENIPNKYRNNIKVICIDLI